MRAYIVVGPTKLKPSDFNSLLSALDSGLSDRNSNSAAVFVLV